MFEVSAKETIENDAAQVESSGADNGKWNCSIKRRTGSSEKTVREKEATDYSKSEAELVKVADTVKRAISERR